MSEINTLPQGTNPCVGRRIHADLDLMDGILSLASPIDRLLPAG